MSIIPVPFQCNGQHIILEFHFLGSRDLEYVLQSHTTERNLLLYGEVVLQMEVVRISAGYYGTQARSLAIFLDFSESFKANVLDFSPKVVIFAWI